MSEVGEQIIEASQDPAAFAQGQTQGRRVHKVVVPEMPMSEGATESQRAPRARLLDSIMVHPLLPDQSRSLPVSPAAGFSMVAMVGPDSFLSPQ
jgi:hypothetical protein